MLQVSIKSTFREIIVYIFILIEIWSERGTNHTNLNEGYGASAPGKPKKKETKTAATEATGCCENKCYDSKSCRDHF